MEDYSELTDVNGKFFTKDNIQIYTIYFKNVSDLDGAQTELNKFFSQFGKIYKIQIEKQYKDFDDEIKISGIVQYDEPESAYKALKHARDGFYEIFAADSWIQPAIENHDNKTCKKNEDYCDLLNLNEDCLLHILSMLTLHDLVVLTKSFPILKLKVKQYCKYKKILQLNYYATNRLTLMEVRQFLIDNGEVIENIEILDWHYNVKSIRYLNFVLHFCKELKSLYISSISFKNNDFSLKISKELPKLEKLRLIDCRLDDQSITVLSELKNIKVLDLSGSNNSFTGISLSKFVNLEELHLENCEDVICYNFDKIIFKNIKILNITGCNVPDDSFKIISRDAENLKILKISLDRFNVNQNHFQNFITQMQTLEELIITNTSRTGCTGYYMEIPDMENRLKKLSESKYLQSTLKILHLKSFKLNDNCFSHISKFNNLIELLIGFSNEDPVPTPFWDVVDSLNKLQVIAIKFDGFKSFNISFITKLILHLNKKETKKILTIRADISKKIYNEILQNSIYLQSKEKIKIVPYYFTEPYSHHALSME